MLISPEKVDAICKKIQDDDPDWTYRVKHDPTGCGFSFIEVWDEDNIRLGVL